MSYRLLYEHFQNSGVPVKRRPIREKVAELIGAPIRVAKTSLDVQVCRGMYLSPGNTTHRIVQQLGCHVVVMPREGNNRCWERFVEVKEYMHAFDAPNEATDTGDAFDQLLTEFCSGPVDPEFSPQFLAESKGFWRALGVLCPEPVRQQIISERAERGQELTDYGIALRLRIPEQYVPRLFEDWYLDNLQELLV